MKFGVQVNCYRTTWRDLKASIEAMEGTRWNSLWFADHFLPPGRREDEYLAAFEGYTLISVAAGMTRKLRLGHLVLGNTYRNPGLLAKMATTLDQASEGRFELALGAAWFKREHEAYGWPFPSMKERQDRFQEACELLRLLFTADGPVDYEGQYYRLAQAPLSPGCFQKPHIPIMVGGTGERRTLRTLALYGDIFNMDGWAGQGMSLDVYRHKIGVLEKHCADVGRDPAQIKRTLLMPLQITDDKGTYRALPEGVGAGLHGRPQESDHRPHRRVRAGGGGGDHVRRHSPTGNIEMFERVEEEIVSAFD